MKKKSKILNKLLTVLMVVLIVAALCVPAFAADIPIQGVWDVFDTDAEGNVTGYAFFFTAPLDLVAGQTYTVTWDGVEYSCVAYVMVDDDISCVALGGEGYPFGIASALLADGVYGYALNISDLLAQPSFSISGNTSSSGSASDRNYILSPVTIPDSGTYGGTYTTEMVEGESYFVSLNGVEYEIVCDYYSDLDAALLRLVLPGDLGGYLQYVDSNVCVVQAAAGSTVSVYTKVPPFEALVNNVGSLVSGSVGWVGQFVSAVTSNALLLCFMIVIFVGVGVGLISRIKK